MPCMKTQITDYFPLSSYLQGKSMGQSGLGVGDP